MFLPLRMLAVFLVAVAALAPSAARADGAPDGVRLATVIDAGLAFPTGVGSPGDGSGRMFVMERGGRIRIIDREGALLAEPWYRRAVMTDDIEQGLLGMAFDPDFRSNGTLYIAYSATPGEQYGMIVRRLVAADPAADTFEGSDDVVLRVAGLAGNHNGGDLRFGPDGMLYMSVGAGPGDPQEHAHAAATDTLLGKILRLDVRQPRRKGPSNRCGRSGGSVSYSIPDDNPFAGQRGQCGEIWLYGLRNPWRFGVDAASGDVWIGDVGKDREELSVYRAGTDLRDLGFPRCQGKHDYPSTGAEDCPQRTGTLAPVYDYAGGYRDRCAIVGGLPYRGAIPALRGSYVFADACSSEIIIGTPDGAGWDWHYWNAGIAPGYGTVASFGEDADGELYFVNHLAGAVYRLEANR